MSPRLGKRTCLAIVALALFVYLATASKHVLGGDNGEFATLFSTGGIAHPPGYPAYVLLLRMFHWLPSASPAHGAALVTAALGAAGVLLLQVAARAWGASWNAAAIVSAGYAFSPVAWRLSTQAEVFTLNVVLAGALVTLAAPNASFSPRVRGFATGLVLGLGASHHHSLAMLFPVAAFAWFTAASRPRNGGALALGLLGGAIGLLPYLYVLDRARHADPSTAWVWGDPTTFEGLFAHFRREQYGSTQLSIQGGAPRPMSHLPALAKRLVTDTAGLAVLLPLAAGLAMFRIGFGAPKSARLALVLGWLFVGPAFIALFNLPLEGIGAVVVERFYLLPVWMTLLLAALALDDLASSYAPSHATRALPAMIAALTLLVLRGSASAQGVAQEHRPSIEAYAVDTLTLLPKNAILLCDGDHRIGALQYERLARGVRQDVVFASPLLLLTRWHHEQTSRALGITLSKPDKQVLPLVRVLSEMLSTGRPLFMCDLAARGIERNFSWYPIGTTLRVLPRGSNVPSPEELENENIAWLSRMTFDPALAEDPWASSLRGDFARPWTILGQAYAAAGSEADAARNRARAEAFTGRDSSPN